MKNIIDARGLSCPQPVILVTAKMKEMASGEFTILVDTDTAKENVSRAARSNHWVVGSIEPDGDGYRNIVKKD